MSFDVVAVIEKIDRCIDGMEKALEEVCLSQGSKIKLPGAEFDLLKELEVSRDLMNDCMEQTASCRTKLGDVFGVDDCIRILRILGICDYLETNPLSPMNRDDQRLKGGQDACNSVIEVLKDMGYGKHLSTKLIYKATKTGLSFSRSFVGEVIDPIMVMPDNFVQVGTDQLRELGSTRPYPLPLFMDIFCMCPLLLGAACLVCAFGVVFFIWRGASIPGVISGSTIPNAILNTNTTTPISQLSEQLDNFQCQLTEREEEVRKEVQEEKEEEVREEEEDEEASTTIAETPTTTTTKAPTMTIEMPTTSTDARMATTTEGRGWEDDDDDDAISGRKDHRRRQVGRRKSVDRLKRDDQRGQDDRRRIENAGPKTGDKLRNLKWRWAENRVGGYLVPKIGFEDKWNVPVDRTALEKELHKKGQKSKQHKARAVEIADVEYPSQRLTFVDYTKALAWLKLGWNIESHEEL